MEQARRDGHDANLAALHVEDLRARVARRCRRGLLPTPRGLRLLRVTQRRAECQAAVIQVIDESFIAKAIMQDGALLHQRDADSLRLSGMSCDTDIRQAVRLIRKAPWFTAASVCVSVSASGRRRPSSAWLTPRFFGRCRSAMRISS